MELTIRFVAIIMSFLSVAVIAARFLAETKLF